MAAEGAPSQSAQMAQGIASGASAAGSIISGIGGFQAGKANAELKRAEARGALREGVAQEGDIRQQGRRVAGGALAAMAANGLEINTGSALDVLAETQSEAMLDRMRVRAGAYNRAEGLRFEATAAKRAGAAALAGGLLDGISKTASAVAGAG